MDSINVNGGQTVAYTYNPLGQRVVKELANGDKEIYHYDEAGQLIAVMDGADNRLREYIYWDGKQVAMVRSGNIYYIHNDHLNTPQVITDANQQVVWMANYEPFGKLAANQTNSIEVYSRFPGQYLDQETGLYYNYFRDYDPSIGRYLTSDPIGLQGGINTYAYVISNPINRKDPLGLAPNKACVFSYTAAGGALGGAAGYWGGGAGGGFLGAFAGGVGAIPGAAGGSTGGGYAGAAGGAWAGHAIGEWVCPDDEEKPEEEVDGDASDCGCSKILNKRNNWFQGDGIYWEYQECLRKCKEEKSCSKP